MTPEQITLVEESFASVRGRLDELTRRLYATMFELDPGLRTMFGPDLRSQRAKLSAAIATTVQGLRFPHRLTPVLHDLGRRHLGYGVRAEHYDTVGAALVDALVETLDEAPGSAVIAAWAAAYDLIASTMQAGTVPAASERAA